MITKILRRFCSPEVEMMLKHLEECPEDFKEGLGYKKWERLANAIQNEGTFAEQRVLRAVMAKEFKRLSRQKLLGAIVTQTINPEADVEREYDIASDQYTIKLSQSMKNTALSAQGAILQAEYQRQMMNQAQGSNYGGLQQAQGLTASTNTCLQQP